MILPFFQVDAFAPAPLTGNPAAVMPLEQWLLDATLQAIAAENNLSETAFTMPFDGAEADFHLRWFTPTVEIGMCGHATLAAGHVLLRGDEVRFATRQAGILTVRRRGAGLELSLPAWVPEPGTAPDALAALGVQGPLSRASGAEEVIIVLLADEAAVRAVQPDFRAMRDIDALIVVTAPGERHDVASRVFAANVGIDEDPVTGAAHAALIPYWAERLGRDQFTAAQVGRRGGELHCRYAADRVHLGGEARTVIEGSFHL